MGGFSFVLYLSTAKRGLRVNRMKIISEYKNITIWEHNTDFPIIYMLFRWTLNVQSVHKWTEKENDLRKMRLKSAFKQKQKKILNWPVLYKIGNVTNLREKTTAMNKDLRNIHLSLFRHFHLFSWHLVFCIIPF